jgi:hypothetical protein
MRHRYRLAPNAIAEVGGKSDSGPLARPAGAGESVATMGGCDDQRGHAWGRPPAGRVAVRHWQSGSSRRVRCIWSAGMTSAPSLLANSPGLVNSTW